MRPEARSGFFAAFLTAQGKVLHDVFVYPTLGTKWHRDTLERDGKGKEQEQGYLVEVDADQASSLFAHVRRHKLRAKLAIRLLEAGELDAWSAWREGEKWTPHSSTLSCNGEENTSSDGAISLVDSRAPGLGKRLLLPSNVTTDQQPLLSELTEAPLSAYTLRRYLRGVPEGQAEIPRDNAFPMNNDIDTMGGIDFKKGCYIGQELTIRTHHTGVVRRRVLPVSLYDTAAEPPAKLEYNETWNLGTPTSESEFRVEGKRGKPGKWIAGIGNVGLAMCRLEMMTDLVVTGEPSQFNAEDRFNVRVDGEEGEKEVGVKAFVPDWLRGKIRTPKVQKRVE